MTRKTRSDAPLKLAIVGRPNAGKSTLINRMIGEDRLITGPEAGITRDSIAIDWEWRSPDGETRPVRLIDTAGMRKNAKVAGQAREAVGRRRAAARSISPRWSCCCSTARCGLEAQDLRIADHVLEEGRALVIAINKWDVAEDAGAACSTASRRRSRKG